MKKSVSVLFMIAGILFASCLLISNILATKVLMIGSWSAPAGVIIFPIVYILNDVITEVWGFSKARLIIWIGFTVNLMAILFFTAGIAIPGAPFWTNQQAFETILGNTPRIVMASLTAYLAGSFLNAFVMSRMKVLTHGKGFSARAILSTLIGETADSFLFITVAFLEVFPLNVLLTMVVTQALLKTVYEIMVLPVTIGVVKWVKKNEGTDTYDIDQTYKLFHINEI
jgi:queuosine precursor transporter